MVESAHPPGVGQVVLGTAAHPSPIAAGDQLLGVYRLSDPSLSELPVARLLDELLLRIQQLLEVDTVAILLLDPEREELVARAAKGIEEAVRQGVRIPVGRGFAGRIAKERAPIFIADVDHADVLNPLLRQAGIRSLLGVPMIVEGEVLGVLHVGSLTPREFDDADAVLLQLAASRAGPAIERAQLFDVLDKEHRGAVALQRSLLPDALPAIPGIEVAARYLPARAEVGGDWYDVLELPDGNVGLAIGDVAGHGVRAAALMGQLRTGLRAYALEGHGPAATLARLDELLQAIRGRGMATVCYAVFDFAACALTVASAGHPPPLVISASGEARLLDVHGAPPLGAVPFAQFAESTESLADGDTVALYTDGLVEVRGVALAQMFERLRRAAETKGPSSADAVCERLLDRLRPEREADDDVALLALSHQPVGPSLRLHVPAEPDVLRGLRRTLRRWLAEQGAGDDDVQAILLASGEACANAVEHAYGPEPATFDVEADAEDGVVRLVVRDHGRWRDPRGEHRGRGLQLMEATMDEVTVTRGEAGSEVVLRRSLRS